MWILYIYSSTINSYTQIVDSMCITIAINQDKLLKLVINLFIIHTIYNFSMLIS